MFRACVPELLYLRANRISKSFIQRGELFELVGTERDRMPFPVSVDALRQAEFVSELLRQALFCAGLSKAVVRKRCFFFF